MRPILDVFGGRGLHLSPRSFCTLESIFLSIPPLVAKLLRTCGSDWMEYGPLGFIINMQLHKLLLAPRQAYAVCAKKAFLPPAAIHETDNRRIQVLR
jgi:hypothetical protein